jgi:hypothetical protein
VRPTSPGPPATPSAHPWGASSPTCAATPSPTSPSPSSAWRRSSCFEGPQLLAISRQQRPESERSARPTPLRGPISAPVQASSTFPSGDDTKSQPTRGAILCHAGPGARGRAVDGLAVASSCGALRVAQDWRYGEFAENVPEDPRNLLLVTVAVTLGRRSSCRVVL